MSHLSSRRQVRDLVRKLQAQYGVSAAPEEAPPIDRMLWSILVTANGPTAAHRALKRLTEDFVDLNEVRVSQDWEIAESLKAARVAHPETKAEQIRLALERTMSDRHRLSFDDLLAQEADQACRQLAPYDAIHPRIRGELILGHFETDRFPIPAGAETFLKRLGVFPPDVSAQEMEKALRGLFTAKEARGAHDLLCTHVERLCGAEPACSQCFLSGGCREAQRRRAERREARSRKPPALAQK
jgi:endonuclease III